MNSDLEAICANLGTDMVKLAGNETSVRISDVSPDAQWTAVFLTAQHCRLCAAFLPKLKDFAARHEGVRVVAFLQDDEKDVYDAYRAQLPFYAFDFVGSEKNAAVLRMLGIVGYPIVLLFDAHGNLKTKRGREMIMNGEFVFGAHAAT